MPFFDEEQKQQLRLFGRYGGIGIQIAASIGLGALGGQWLDRRLGTDPWLFLVGLLLGIAAAGKGLYDLVRRAKRDDLT